MINSLRCWYNINEEKENDFNGYMWSGNLMLNTYIYDLILYINIKVLI